MAQSIEQQLAHHLGRRDETPNIALAEKVVKAKNGEAVSELISLLSSPVKGIRHDAIKVLYEIGERNAGLVNPYTEVFLHLLDHKDNRMIWGAMSTLAAISAVSPEPVAKKLVLILGAMERGSVITRDKGIAILAHVAGLRKYHKDAMDLLLEQISAAPVNQVPMYAEKMAAVITQPYAKKLISILKERHDVWAIDSKARRLDKLIRSLQAVSS